MGLKKKHQVTLEVIYPDDLDRTDLESVLFEHFQGNNIRGVEISPIKPTYDGSRLTLEFVKTGIPLPTFKDKQKVVSLSRAVTYFIISEDCFELIVEIHDKETLIGATRLFDIRKGDLIEVLFVNDVVILYLNNRVVKEYNV